MIFFINAAEAYFIFFQIKDSVVSKATKGWQSDLKTSITGYKGSDPKILYVKLILHFI